MPKPTPKEILEIQGTDPRYVTRDQISWLSRNQISGLSRNQISWLSRNQISGLSRNQISWLSSDQISGLSRSQISWLSRNQISGLSRSQISGLSRNQISWLSRNQISGLSSECQEILGLENVPVLDQPYTKILEAVNRGKLDMATWHRCETTHCVGGWTVALALGGKAFEAKLNDNTALAAELILRASRPDAPLPNFTASNEAAMAFIEARAAEEKAGRF